MPARQATTYSQKTGSVRNPIVAASTNVPIQSQSTAVSVRFGPIASVTRPQTIPAGTANRMAVAMTIRRCVAACSDDRPPATDTCIV